MDPTAPKDPLTANPATGGSTSEPSSPIQPGQFVEASSDSLSSPQAPHHYGAGQAPPSAVGQAASATAPEVPSNLPQAPHHYGAEQVLPPTGGKPPPSPMEASTTGQYQGTMPPSPESAGPVTPSSAAGPAQPPVVNQPDPTPYVPPQAGVPQGFGESSKIELARKIAIVVAILVLLALIVAVVWFFVLGKKTEEPVKTQAGQDQLIEEPSPLVKPTTGGFGELPEATSESTPSGEESPTPPPTE